MQHRRNTRNCLECAASRQRPAPSAFAGKLNKLNTVFYTYAGKNHFMPCKTQHTEIRLHYLLILVVTIMAGCDNELSPTPSSTTNAESPAIKATMAVNTVEEADSTSPTGSRRVTQIQTRFFDLSGGDENPFALVQGDIMTATTIFTGTTFDFGANTFYWSAQILGGTVTTTLTRDAATESLQLNPVWADAADDVIAVFDNLFRSADFNTGAISLDIYVPQAYVTDGNMLIHIFMRDSENIDALFDSVAVSTLTGDDWNTISVSNIDAALLQAEAGFDLSDVRYFGVQFVSNGKAVATSGNIQIDNVAVTVPPIEQESTFALFFDSENKPVHITQFTGGIPGQPVTVSANRSTVPETPWFPDDDSSEPNFSDLLFNAQASSVDLPVIEITSPSSSVPSDESTHYEVDADSVTIEWAPSGSADEIDIEYLNDCGFGIVGGSKEITGDPGSATYTINEFLQEQETSDGTKIYETFVCLIRIKLLRKTIGTIDPVFAAGSEITALHESFIVNLLTIPLSSS
jgi:hypothetical protein